VSALEDRADAALGVPEFADLDRLLSGDDPDFDAQPSAPDDEVHADRWLRKLRRIEERAQRVRDVAQAERELIDEYERAELAKVDHDRAWLTESLRQYHRARLTDDPKAKTIRLPNGTLKARAQQPLWEYDESQFIAWALDNRAELVRQIVQERPDKTAVRDQVSDGHLAIAGVSLVEADTGEPIPGVTITPRGVGFSVVLEDAE
jgi:phage host-nuclease inhibitor protein Gam